MPASRQRRRRSGGALLREGCRRCPHGAGRRDQGEFVAIDLALERLQPGRPLLIPWSTRVEEALAYLARRIRGAAAGGTEAQGSGEGVVPRAPARRRPAAPGKILAKVLARPEKLVLEWRFFAAARTNETRRSKQGEDKFFKNQQPISVGVWGRGLGSSDRVLVTKRSWIEKLGHFNSLEQNKIELKSLILAQDEPFSGVPYTCKSDGRGQTLEFERVSNTSENAQSWGDNVAKLR